MTLKKGIILVVVHLANHRLLGGRKTTLAFGLISHTIKVLFHFYAAFHSSESSVV